MSEPRRHPGADRRIVVVRVRDAAPLVESLFRRMFNAPPPSAGVHYVAFAEEADCLFRVAGYYWMSIPCEYVLVGGLCVDPEFRNAGIGYKLETATFADTGDAKGMFCYAGNPTRALRIGFAPTPKQHLLVKWLRSISETKQQQLIEEVAALGPF